MAEYIAVTPQTVEPNRNIIFTDSVYCNTKPCIVHRKNSGLVTLRGLTNQCRARFRVHYSGNVAVPTGVTPGTVTMALALNGEALAGTVMSATPAAVNEYFNISTEMIVDVPKNVNYEISVMNNSAVAVLAQNANLIVERIA